MTKTPRNTADDDAKAEARAEELPVADAAGVHSINEPPGSDVVPPAEPLTVTDLEPSEAAIGDPDLTLTVTGSGFNAGAQIVFNAGLEATEFVSDTELTTTVKPSLATVAGDYPVTVVQGGMQAEPPLMFTFTEVGADPASRSKRRR